MRSPFPWLLLLLLMAGYGAWRHDTIMLDGDAAALQRSISDKPALPDAAVVQVFFQGAPDCPSMTWLKDRWLTIEHRHDERENRPGRKPYHFRLQWQALQARHPECAQQQWVLYGRLTPQRRFITHDTPLPEH
jgi:hypothetical protein